MSLDLDTLPSYCAHEHWGSIDSIGTLPQGFRADSVQGALPTRRTGLFDLLLDPYFGGFMRQGGDDPDALAQAAGYADMRAAVERSVPGALNALRPALRRQRLVGAYQCLRRGIARLYGVDIDEDADPRRVQALDDAVAANYANPFTWYTEVMQRAPFAALIRPAQPEFYLYEDTPETAAQERAFTRSMLRVDPLLDMWRPESSRRSELAQGLGVEDPRDAAGWRALIGALFERAAHGGALGIKQLQAYTRPLEFVPHSDDEVAYRGDLAPAAVRAFQDWVVHACCEQAEARGWPFQVHVGTHNLTQSNPLPLAALAARYPRIAFVQLHCWPFVAEAGWLAKHLPNVYIDACWQPILSPSFLRESFATWLTYVPAHKLMCSHDATSVEMAVGALCFLREALAGCLTEAARPLGLGEGALIEIARDVMCDNAQRLYAAA